MTTDRKLSVWVKVILLLFFVAILLLFLSVCSFVCLFVFFFRGGGGRGSMGKILIAKAREVKKLIVNQ